MTTKCNIPKWALSEYLHNIVIENHVIYKCTAPQWAQAEYLQNNNHHRRTGDDGNNEWELL